MRYASQRCAPSPRNSTPRLPLRLHCALDATKQPKPANISSQPHKSVQCRPFAQRAHHNHHVVAFHELVCPPRQPYASQSTSSYSWPSYAVAPSLSLTSTANPRTYSRSSDPSPTHSPTLYSAHPSPWYSAMTSPVLLPRAPTCSLSLCLRLLWLCRYCRSRACRLCLDLRMGAWFWMACWRLLSVTGLWLGLRLLVANRAATTQKSSVRCFVVSLVRMLAKKNLALVSRGHLYIYQPNCRRTLCFTSPLSGRCLDGAWIHVLFIGW